MKDFKQLTVFQKTRIFNKEIYLKTKNFPTDERFGITNQIRRASVSIATNIAEGCGRNSDKEFARFLNIAYASACEVECLLLISSDLELIDRQTLSSLQKKLDEITVYSTDDLFTLGASLCFADVIVKNVFFVLD